MPEVFVLSTASPRTYSAASLHNSSLGCSRSTIASIIQSDSRSRCRSVLKDPARIRSNTAWSSTTLGRIVKSRRWASSTISTLKSSRSQSTPQLAISAAICAPIVPAPSTATRRMSDGAMFPAFILLSPIYTAYENIISPGMLA